MSALVKTTIRRLTLTISHAMLTKTPATYSNVQLHIQNKGY